jgi:tetratricopeptide (TPR) repeat protein
MTDQVKHNALVSKARNLVTACQRGDMSKVDEAIACADKLLKANPHQLNSLMFKGLALSAAKKSQEAILCYNHIIKSFPRNYMGYLNKGCEMHILKRCREAHELFDKSIELEPNESKIYIKKGECLLELENYEEALKAFTNAAHIDDKNFETLKRMGDCYKSKKIDQNYWNDCHENNEKAVQSYKAALKLQPGDYYCHFNCAKILHWNLRDHAQANEHYDKLIEMRPKEAEFYHYKAKCLSKLNEWQLLLDIFEDANQLFQIERSIVLDINGVRWDARNVYYNRALLYHNLGVEIKTTVCSKNGRSALDYINMCLKMELNSTQYYYCSLAKEDILNLQSITNNKAVDCETAELEVRLPGKRPLPLISFLLLIALLLLIAFLFIDVNCLSI